MQVPIISHWFVQLLLFAKKDGSQTSPGSLENVTYWLICWPNPSILAATSFELSAPPAALLPLLFVDAMHLPL
ncbi:hypothetical protein V6N12_044585 [Hibiscus sabdariffa]